jgi:hypothetical protein
MMTIKDLSRDEMETYLYVRGIIKREAGINNYMSVNDILLLILPIILIIILILIGTLLYRTNEKIIYDKTRIEWTP